MGLSQKQAVAILYCISTVFGLAAVVLATSGRVKALVVALAFMFIVSIAAFVYSGSHRHHEENHCQNGTPKKEPEAPKEDEGP
jgi:UDP-GlcNAc:undecaprenyl-phosphate GlcNAc-1-phosphate transferase